jgi:hypothetical protein
MKVTDMQAQYVCPKCFGKVERAIQSCAGSTEFSNMFKILSNDKLKCAVCANTNPLRISRLIAQKAVVWKSVMLSMKCDNNECGVYFQTRIVMTLDAILRATNTDINEDGFNISCPKCDGTKLTRIKVFVGNPRE